MSKIQLVLTSLVAVIPGAFLIYLLVMAMLFSEALPMMAYIVMGVTLLAATGTVLIPAGVLVGGNRKPRAPNAKKDKKGKAEEAESVSEEVSVAEDVSMVDDEDLALESSEFVVEDADDIEVEPDGEDLFDEGDVETEKVDDFDSFEIEEEDLTGENDFDEIDFDDEPKPKKKR